MEKLVTQAIAAVVILFGGITSMAIAGMARRFESRR